MSRETSADRLVREYLERVRQALRSLPRRQRSQVFDDVREHIREARAHLASDDVRGVQEILAQMGEPEALLSEAGWATEGRGGYEPWVPWLLLLGGFLAGLGWVVGVVGLWLSPRWRVTDKVLGTVVLPGGLAGLFLLGALPGRTTVCSNAGPVGTPLHCSATGYSLPWPLGLAVLVAALAAEVLVTRRLWRHLEGA